MKNPAAGRRSLSRHQTGSNSCQYESLESRQLLASMLYVDFGIGTGDLTINDVQSQSLGGPQIFGLGHTLESLPTTIADSELDLNFDDTLDGSDAAAFIDQVMENLNEIFEVFDVTVVQANSTNFTEIAAKLAEQSTNDAYIFAGGINPIASVDFGASVIDAGNTADNLGFVFAQDVYDSWRATTNSYLGANYELAPRWSWALSRLIAKHAGHSYGLQSIEAANGDARFDVMRLAGTDANGATLPYGQYPTARSISDGSPGVFTRAAENLTTVDGTTPGTQNSYEAMVSAVGSRADAPYYVTGYGDAGSEIQVSSDDSGSLIIQVGDEIFEPSLAEIQNGLLVNTGAVTLGQLPGHQVEIKNASSIKIDQSLDFEFDGGQPDRNIIRSRLEIIPIDRTNYFGTINDNISYDNVRTLESDDGNDIFRFFETINPSGIVETNGIFQSDTYRANDTARGGGGNDIFVINRTTFSISGGDGNDFYQNDGGFAHEHLGGGGFDIVETSWGTHWNLFLLGEQNGAFEMAGGWKLEGTGDSGVDRYSYINGASVRLTNHSGYPIFPYHSFTWIQNGDRTIISEKATGARMEITGLIREINSGPTDDLYIRSTAYDLEINGGKYVQFSSEFDPTLGHTNNIQHRVTLKNLKQVVIGAKAGSGVQALIGENFLSGLTGGLIRLEGTLRPNITVHGSETASDFIAIASSSSRITLFGNGGNDFFTVGYNHGGAASLDRVKGFVQLDGGDGNDFVMVQDVGASDLKIANRYVSKNPVAGSPQPTFGVVQYDNFETFRANIESIYAGGRPYTATIWGSPKTTYQYNILSNSTVPRTDELVLIGGNPNDGRTFVVAAEPQYDAPQIRGGIWNFADARKPIVINRTHPIFIE